MKKMCLICGKEILRKEAYYKLGRYFNKKLDKEVYYHLKCYEERDNVKKLALGMAGRAMQMMSKVEQRLEN